MYVAAGGVYGLEVELSDLEECARAVGSATPGLELDFLEEQVASAAARVHQSDLQVSSRPDLKADVGRQQVRLECCLRSRFPTSPPGSLL